MKIMTKALVTDTYTSQKTGSQYVTMIDLDTYGQFVLVIDGKAELSVGQVIDLDIAVKTRVYKGYTGITYTAGSIKKSELNK